MPAPDATPLPTPPAGIVGKQFQKVGDSLREPTPDGGYILWQKEDVNGETKWMPVKHVSPDKYLEA